MANKLPARPMEFIARDEIPSGDWLYEPKWDGFRCLLSRDGKDVVMRSKSGQPLERYFPELVEAATALKSKSFAIDGEIVMRSPRHSFDDLLQRIHPAISRVTMLAQKTPAIIMAFDLLWSDGESDVLLHALSERRQKLEAFMRRNASPGEIIRLSPATKQRSVAEGWLLHPKAAMDGIVAKHLGLPYDSGGRKGGEKIKRIRTADCVVGGFRWSEAGGSIGSLLLGLYSDDKLDHVGFTSSFTAEERKSLVAKLKPLIKAPGFTGKRPGGPSRWSTKRSDEWEPLQPKLVVEVAFDRVTGERIRHGARFVRWRPDKAPRSCTMDQITSK